jgi:hypothetical protein
MSSMAGGMMSSMAGGMMSSMAAAAHQLSSCSQPGVQEQVPMHAQP